MAGRSGFSMAVAILPVRAELALVPPPWYAPGSLAGTPGRDSRAGGLVVHAAARVQAGRAQRRIRREDSDREEASAMAATGSGAARAAGRAPAADQVRNVVLVGHSGSREDDPGRGAARRDRDDPAAGRRRRRHHGQRLRRGRDPAAAFGQPDPRAARRTTASRSTCSTRLATPTSPATCGPGCGRRTPRCSPSPPPTGSTA